MWSLSSVIIKSTNWKSQGSFLGHFSSVLPDSVFKTRQLRSVLGKFLRPFYLFRYFSFKTTRIPIIFFTQVTYILSLILTSHSNATFLQLLLISPIPIPIPLELLPEFVQPLASLFWPFPTFLFPLLIFSPDNWSKNDFYNKDVII